VLPVHTCPQISLSGFEIESNSIQIVGRLIIRLAMHFNEGPIEVNSINFDFHLCKCWNLLIYRALIICRFSWSNRVAILVAIRTLKLPNNKSIIISYENISVLQVCKWLFSYLTGISFLFFVESTPALLFGLYFILSSLFLQIVIKSWDTHFAKKAPCYGLTYLVKEN